MKTWKLVSGILSIVLSVFVLFQSALAGVANTMSANGEAGGSAGLFVAILFTCWWYCFYLCEKKC